MMEGGVSHHTHERKCNSANCRALQKPQWSLCSTRGPHRTPQTSLMLHVNHQHSSGKTSREERQLKHEMGKPTLYCGAETRVMCMKFVKRHGARSQETVMSRQNSCALSSCVSHAHTELWVSGRASWVCDHTGRRGSHGHCPCVPSLVSLCFQCHLLQTRHNRALFKCPVLRTAAAQPRSSARTQGPLFAVWPGRSSLHWPHSFPSINNKWPWL